MHKKPTNYLLLGELNMEAPGQYYTPLFNGHMVDEMM